MKIIDTHIHLADFANKTTDSTVAIVPAIIETDWQKIIDLCQNNKNLIPAFGIHPWYVNQTKPNWFDKLENIIKNTPNALIGETGLDRHKDKDYNPQNDYFKKHLMLAKKYSRPVIIHAVKCNEWLEEYWQELSTIRFVFHSYNARRELLKKIINAGGYVSFSNSILNNREKDKILQAVPLDRIMIETDGPYQQGSIKDIAAQIASILNLDYQEFLNIVYNNTIKFLGQSK